jgi:hypothetical protein
MPLTWRLVRWVIANARWFMIGGLALGLVAVRFDGLCGFTACMVIWLGTSGATFRECQSEAGLWMLSGLFLAIALTGFLLVGIGLTEDIAQARAQTLADSDVWAATVLLAVQSLFLSTVTITNWSLRKRSLKKKAIPDL